MGRVGTRYAGNPKRPNNPLEGKRAVKQTERFVALITDQYGTPMLFGPFVSYEAAETWAHKHRFPGERLATATIIHTLTARERNLRP